MSRATQHGEQVPAPQQPAADLSATRFEFGIFAGLGFAVGAAGRAGGVGWVVGAATATGAAAAAASGLAPTAGTGEAAGTSVADTAGGGGASAQPARSVAVARAARTSFSERGVLMCARYHPAG
jgi:hypothetical protein